MLVKTALRKPILQKKMPLEAKTSSRYTRSLIRHTFKPFSFSPPLAVFFIERLKGHLALPFLIRRHRKKVYCAPMCSFDRTNPLKHCPTIIFALLWLEIEAIFLREGMRSRVITTDLLKPGNNNDG